MLQGSPPEVLDIVFCTQTKHSCHNEEFCLGGRGFKIPGACEDQYQLWNGCLSLAYSELNIAFKKKCTSFVES